MPETLPGLPPRQVANQLEWCLRAEIDLMRVIGGWTARVEENDERLAFARDLGHRAEHGELLQQRLRRLRTTPAMIHVPSTEWRTLVVAIDEAPSTADVIAAVYRTVGTALIEAYVSLAHDCDPLADEPTLRLVERNLVPDHREMLDWADRWLAEPDRQPNPEFQAEVASLLAAAGGLCSRSEAVADDRVDDGAVNGTGFWPLDRPSPATIALGSEYRIASDGGPVSSCPDFADFGPRDVEVLVCHHGLMPEIASLCIVGALLHEIDDRPWAFYRDFAVQASDEVRHIGLLLRRLEELGAGPDTHAFPTWTFYDAVAFLPAKERTLVFNAVVEGNVVETLHDRARALEEAGNHQAAYVMDWISADESLHLLNGMSWLGVPAEEADALLDRGQALLGEVMRQKGVSEKVFDSASEALSAGDFYAPRSSPVAPIVRELGGFSQRQIAKLVTAADGRTIRR